mgnify:CR=1 FL=1
MIFNQSFGDDVRKRRWLIGCGFLAALIALIVLLNKACEYAGDQDRIAKVTATSEVLQELDALCSDVDKPAGLNFSRKSLGGNSFTSHIGHHFSGGASFGEIRSLAFNWALRNSWEIRKMEDTSEFLSVTMKKERTTINIGKIGTEYYYGCGRITR